MLKKFKISSKSKAKGGVSLPPPPKVTTRPSDFLDYAKYGQWTDMEKWLAADPSRPDHINDTPNRRWSALHQAAWFGSDEACTLLLRYGANPTLKNGKGETPADVASSRGFDSLYMKLMDAAWRSGRKGETLFRLLQLDPYIERSQFREEAVLEVLNEDPGAARMRFPFVSYSRRPMYPVFPSVRIGASAKVVSALCNAHPAALEGRTCSGWTLLHEACSWGAPIDTLEFLVSKIPNALGSQNDFGQTPLHIACANDASPEVVRLVAEVCPDAVHMEDCEGRTPIMLARQTGRSPEVEEVLDRYAKAKEFYVKLMEDEDRDINFKISELIPLIHDVHSARFFYTLVNAAFKSEGITSNERARHVAEGLRIASTTTTCTDSTALFEVLLEKARKDGAITDLESKKLGREAAVVHMAHAPFVKELWKQVKSNTARIDGLEHNLAALNTSVEKLKSGIRYQQRVETAVGLMGAVLNAVSFGMAGSALSAATNAAIGGIVDFGDVVHMEAVVQSVGNASVKDAFEMGLKCAEAGAEFYLDKAVAEGKPIATIAFAAKVVDTKREEMTVPPVPSLIDRIKYLEGQVSSGETPTNISERIGNLEVTVLGSTQEEHGGFLQRVDRLEGKFGVIQGGT